MEDCATPTIPTTRTTPWSERKVRHWQCSAFNNPSSVLIRACALSFMHFQSNWAHWLLKRSSVSSAKAKLPRKMTETGRNLTRLADKNWKSKWTRNTYHSRWVVVCKIDIVFCKLSQIVNVCTAGIQNRFPAQRAREQRPWRIQNFLLPSAGPQVFGVFADFPSLQDQAHPVNDVLTRRHWSQSAVVRVCVSLWFAVHKVLLFAW